MSAADPQTVDEVNLSIYERLTSLGITPSVTDLLSVTAFNRLFRQLIFGLNGSAGSIGIFTFRPGAVAPLPPRVYNNFATLYADAILHEGLVVIAIDDAIVAPAPIPAGNWFFPNKNLILSGNGVRNINVDLQDQCKFSGLIEVTEFLTLNSLSSSPIITVPLSFLPQPDLFILGRGCRLNNFGTSFFFDVLPDALLIIGMPLSGGLDSTNIVNLQPSILGNTGVFTFVANNSQIVSDFVTGDATGIWIGNEVGTSNLINQVQPNLLGTIFIQLSAESTRLNYAPANLADWSGIPPTSVSDALDRIAAKITPIP